MKAVLLGCHFLWWDPYYVVLTAGIYDEQPRYLTVCV